MGHKTMLLRMDVRKMLKNVGDSDSSLDDNDRSYPRNRNCQPLRCLQTLWCIP